MADFKNASETVMKLKTPANNDEKLLLYGLFKQGTAGNIKIAQPWAIQVEARAKWEAWNKQKGKLTAEAQKEYVQVATQLIRKYGTK